MGQDPTYNLEGIPDISQYNFDGIPDAPRPSTRSQGAGPSGTYNTDVPSGRRSGAGPQATAKRNTPIPMPAPKGNRWGALPAPQDILLGLGKGYLTASSLPIGLADLVTGGYTGKAMDWLGYDLEESKRILSSYGSEGTIAAQSEFEGTPSIGGKLSVLGRNPGMLATQAVEQVPEMAAQYVLGGGVSKFFPKMSPTAVTAAAGGLSSAGHQATAIRTDPENKSRLLSPTQIGLSVATGGLGALLSGASAKFAKIHGFEDVESLLRGVRNNPSLSSTYNRMVINAVKSASAEAVIEEAPDEMKDQILQNVAVGRPWHSGVAEAGLLGFGTGFLMGAGGSAYSDITSNRKTPPPPTQPNLPFGPGGGGYTQPNLPTSGPTEPDAPPINLGTPVPSAPIPGSVPLPFNTASTTPEGQVGLPFDLNTPIPPPTPPPTGPTGGGPAPPKANSINVKVGQNQLQAIQEAERNGYQVGGYDEFGNVRMTLRPAPKAPSNFGIPTERLGPADTAISGNRLTELGQQFSQGRTATQPPANAVSEQGYQDLLGKLGGRQEVAPDEDTPFNLTQEVLPPEAKGAFREAYDKYIKEGMSPAMAETFALQDEKTGSRAASEMLTNPARPGRTIEGSAMGRKTEDLLGRGRKLLGMSDEDILDAVNSKRTRNARDRRDTEPQGDREPEFQREPSPELKAKRAQLDDVIEQLMDDPNNKVLRAEWNKLSDDVAKLSAKELMAGKKRGYFDSVEELKDLQKQLADVEANKNILTPTEYQTAIKQLINQYNKMAEGSGAGKGYNIGGKEQAAFDEGVKGFENLDTKKTPLMQENKLDPEDYTGTRSTEDLFKSPRTIFGVPEPQGGKYRLDMSDPDVRQIMTMDDKEELQDLVFKYGTRIREIDKEAITQNKKGDLSPENKKLIKLSNAASTRLNQLVRAEMDDVQFSRDPRAGYHLEADETIRSMREIGLKHADELEDQGKQDHADSLRKIYNDATEAGPENWIKQAREQNPAVAEEAESLYKEQDLETISNNHHEYEHRMREAAEQIVEVTSKLPLDQAQKVFKQYGDLTMLANIARSKYERAAVRVNRGEAEFAKKVVASGLKTEVNVENAVDELTNAYNGPLPGIMSREGLQNAFDAIKKMGSGNVTVKVENDSLTITDTGKGMTLDELMTVYKDLNESGKANDPDATGGKGIGKATYMLGGAHFSAETTVKEKDGSIVKYTLGGTPKELRTNYGIEAEDMPPGTPTGTTFTTKFTQAQIDAGANSDANSMIERIRKWSRDIPVELTSEHSWEGMKTKPINSFKDDKKIGGVKVADSQVDFYIPKGDNQQAEDDGVVIQVLNNGMFQYNQWMRLSDKNLKGMPHNVIINVKPTAKEGTTAYPFPVARESLKDPYPDQIKEALKVAIAHPLANKNKKDLMDFWNNLPKFPRMNTLRQALMFDSGSRLTPEELDSFQQSPTIRDFIDRMDTAINGILEMTNQGPEIRTDHQGVTHTIEPDWTEKVKYIGLLLDDKINGIHIPHPQTKEERSAILINMFNNLPNRTPAQAAMDTMVTAMHEVAHVGQKTVKRPLELREEDLSDPRVGTYLAAYFREVKDQGGISPGHGMDFVHRMADIWSGYGTRRAMDQVDAITQILSDPDNPGEYNPEVKRLLSIYQESRGRPETKTDILSRTGIQSKSTGSGTGPVAGGNNPTGNGPPPTGKKRGLTGGILTRFAVKKDQDKQDRKNMLAAGYVPSGFSNKNGDPIWEKRPDEQLNAFNEAWNIPRGMMSVDLPFLTSAAFRQGLPMIGVNARGWAQGWNNARKAYWSEEAAAKVMNELAKAPTMRRGKDPKTGAYTPSYAEKVGLALTDTYSLTRREESIKSRWTEKLPWVAASNRAYTAFLNTTRVSSLERFVKQAQEDSLLHKITGGKYGQAGRDPMTDLVLGEEIADAINVLTGRGKLEVEFTPKGTPLIGQKKYSLDKTSAAKYLVDVFFSPRLVASRLKLMNPNTYMSADPFVRKLFIKGMLGAIGTWWSIAALLELNGAEVNKNPNSANFGKIRMGNTRIDPGGGFQQWMVLGSRLRPNYPYFKSPVPIPTLPYGNLVEDPGGNKFTSSTGVEGTTDLGKGSDPLTRYDLLHDFTRSKMHPSLGLAVDILDKSKNKPVFVGDRALQMITPMMAGDIAEVIQANMLMVPLVIGAGSLGMGAATYEGGKRTPTMTPILDYLGNKTLGLPDKTFTENDLVLD